MATRNLARTVTEGGRQGRDMERFATRSERQKARKDLHRIKEDPEAVWGKFFHERRNWEETSFGDRLRPVERWLQANAGRPWDKVFSELCQKYDRRTLKGWHMIDGHVLSSSMVFRPEHQFKYGAPFRYSRREGAWVDRHGILRYTQRRRWGR